MSTPPAAGPEFAGASARGIGDLPRDELLRYARQLGLDPRLDAAGGELVRRVRERQELLLELDREAMLDVVVWGRRPVRRSASKEKLAQEIAAIHRTDYAALSVRGLRALAALRGAATASSTDEPATLIARLRRADGFFQRLARTRRKIVGAVISGLLNGANGGDGGEYQFLPEDDTSQKVSLREEIEGRGLVGGLASRLRGVADDYVRGKLDEIEARIDRKLDEIDRRLAEWRDREVANRLKIIRITLAASVLFALLSLGYHLFKGQWVSPPAEPAAAVSVEAARPAAAR